MPYSRPDFVWHLHVRPDFGNHTKGQLICAAIKACDKRTSGIAHPSSRFDFCSSLRLGVRMEDVRLLEWRAEARVTG